MYWANYSNGGNRNSAMSAAEALLAGISYVNHSGVYPGGVSAEGGSAFTVSVIVDSDLVDVNSFFKNLQDGIGANTRGAAASMYLEPTE